jgi:23S rRNA (uracil1939-C5)-methyltransferase
VSKAPEVVQIESLGHRGDGIGRGPGGLAYVPFTLPGESVAIDRRGDRGSLLSVLEASGERTLPICRHFGRCGGCALQMMSLDAGRALKRRFVIGALNQQKIEADVAETVGVDPRAAAAL